jgi:2-polyprenyl-3-methyl-5-hydroxy-6-metoxy-1,4-benzoquinol methylase
MLNLGAAGRAFTSYRGAPIASRAFVAARIVVAPLRVLADEVRPLRGRMLSLGCGVAIVERYLAETNPELEIEGLDIDPRKIELIRSTASRSPRVTLRLADVAQLDEPPRYDAVLICDVLHHVAADRHARLATAVERCLQPGGVCLIKDLDRTPRWKFEWNRLHDRIVAGPEPITCRSPAETAQLFARTGLVPERVERTDHALTPYAHYVVRLRKPMSPG